MSLASVAPWHVCCCTAALMLISPLGQVDGWDWSHRGDVRAIVSVPEALVGTEVSVTIVWRRHDFRPEGKRVLVTDHSGLELANITTPVVEQHYGVVTFTPSRLSTNRTYFVYWLPYTQSGIGAGMRFAWDTAPSAHFESIGSFQLAMGTKAGQAFSLPVPHRGSKFRWQCSNTGIGLQPFLSELRLQCGDSGPILATCSGWLPNTATSTNHSPVAGSSGEQPAGDPSGTDGPAWMAMDGNLSTFWDGTSEAAWLDVMLPAEHTITAVEVFNYGDHTHDCSAFELLVPLGSNSSRDWRQLPAVPSAAISIEARTPFESFAPMELAANATEVAAMLAARSVGGNSPPYLLFVEPRELPVRMQDRIPIHWTTAAVTPAVTASVVRGEYFTWQLAVFVPPGAMRVENVSLTFVGLTALTPTCFNLGGVDPQGVSFRSIVTIEADRVRSLWVGTQIPATLAVGTVVKGSMVFGAAGLNSTKISIALTIDGAPVQTAEPEPIKMTRLRWLNSDLYTRDYGLVRPYTAIARQGDTLHILNRQVLIGTSGDGLGLPAQINVTRAASKHGTLPATLIQLLSAPVVLHLLDAHGSPLTIGTLPLCEATPPQYTRHGDGLTSWFAVTGAVLADEGAAASGVCIGINMTLGMEGLISGSITLRAVSNGSDPQAASVALSDVRVQLPLAKQYGLSWMGLATRGQHGTEAGGLSPSRGNFSWRWQTNGHVNGHTNQLFVGSANAGLKIHLRGNTTEWLSPIERFYDATEILPDEWGANNGKGGVNANVTTNGGVDVVLFTGPQSIGVQSSSSSSGVYTLNFDLTITPFKTPNETQHWALRHFQVGYPGSQFTSASDVYKTGANVINIHQGVSTMINPYINYPFVPESITLLANYTREANALGMRVKFYYTVRELSNHAAEIFALRMLEDEIYATGPPCGYGSGVPCGASTAWQKLHLGGNFSSAWTCPLSNGEYDAAIRQNRLAGRWLNYYVEGLRQSVAAPPYIQGVYYDGILFGRDTMLRARKVLERDTPPGHPPALMDFHAGNDDPGNGAVDAVSYANNWAFVDALWIGEGFSYDSNPVFWLFEISGAPFGLFSDMLGTPNNYRGMLFGSTGRPGVTFPGPMWAFWDSFGIADSDMVGFWQEDTPVQVSGQPNIFVNDSNVVLATCYVNKLAKKTLVAVASWAIGPRNVTLDIDWAAVGMQPMAPKNVTAPAIVGFQAAAQFGVVTTEMPAILVQPSKGWLLIIQQD